MQHGKVLLLVIRSIFSKKKVSIPILVLLIFSINNLTAYVFSNFVYQSIYEYSIARDWPAEIMIYSNSPENLSNIAEKIKSVDGVKWFVYPGGGIYIFDAFTYRDTEYVLQIMWCNVSDPTFPHPKYLAEGRFFENNYENAVIVETIGRRLFEHLGIFKGYEKSILNLSKFGFNVSLTFVGAIADILIEGREDGYLEKSNLIFLYVPIETYFRILHEAKYIYSGQITLGPEIIYVRVKEGYDIENIAERIQTLDPNIKVKTIVEEEKELEYEIFIALVIGVILFIVASLVMVWDAINNKDYITLLKVLGWKKKDVLKYFVIKYSTYGLLAGLLGLLLNFTQFISIPPSIQLMQLILTKFIPVQIAVALSVTLVFSIPAIVKGYSVSAEELLRT